MKTKSNKTNNSGFTLIEVLVTSALMVILAAGFLGIQYIFNQNQIMAWNSYHNVEDANIIMQEFTRELRDARESETGDHLLETAGDNEIVFYSDIDHNGLIDRVRYTINGNQIVKGVTKPSGEPADYDLDTEIVKTMTNSLITPTEPTFTYYNEDWPTDTLNNPLPTADRISDTRVVRMNILINISDEERSDFELSSIVTIRMLID